MEALELVLFLLAAVVASSVLDRVLPPLSLPLVQIALGALIAIFVATPFSTGIDPELLLILFIAPLHFNESRHADSGALWKSRWGIASLALGLVLVTVVALGFTLHCLVPAIPLAAGLALGAAMGSTDAVAATGLSKGFRFGRHHETLITGEALFNDVTGTVVFQCATAVLAAGTFSLAHAGEEFVLDFFGGMVGGAIMGFLAWGILELIRRQGIDSPTLHATLELLIPFVIYLVAKQCHIGAIIAVVISGMVMSLMPQRHNAAVARLRLQSKSVWETLEFILNGVIFVILGMQLPRLLEPVADGGWGDPLTLVGIILVLLLVLEAVRFLWILGMDVFRAKRLGTPVKECFASKQLKSALAMTFAGAKGGITLSLMLTLPTTLVNGDTFVVRPELISIASGVILCTLLLANFAVPLLVPHKHSAKRSKERVDLEMKLIERVIGSIQADAHLTGAVRADAAIARTQAAWENAAAEPPDASDEEPGDATAVGVATLSAEEKSAGDEAGRASLERGAVEAPSTGTVVDGLVVDEPATIIVMKQYADQLKELAPHGSKDAAVRARKIIAVCDDLYDRVDVIAEEVTQWDESNDTDDGEPDGSPLTEHFRQLRALHGAVEDVQGQALSRELEYIKELREAGELSPDHAKELRNDVYIQQMTLD